MRHAVSFWCFISVFLFLTCQGTGTKTEKHPDFSKNILEVKEKVIPIKTQVLLGPGKIKNVGSYLLFNDWYGEAGRGFVFFDKKNFTHIGYGGKKGQGPGELPKYKNVHIIPNEQDTNSFFAFDYSQFFLYKYSIDSLLKDRNYLPQKVLKRSVAEVLGNIAPLNDSIFLGMSLRATSSSSFMQRIIKFNTQNNKTQAFGYLNPQIEKLGKGNTHSAFAISLKKGVYVQVFFSQNLITFCDIEGNLICDVYGKMKRSKKSNRIDYYSPSTEMTSKYVFASYVGGNGRVVGKYKRPRGAFPKKIRIFDLQGNYIKTLDFGEELRNFCVDETTNRLFVSFLDRDEPLAYIDLKEILD